MHSMAVMILSVKICNINLEFRISKTLKYFCETGIQQCNDKISTLNQRLREEHTLPDFCGPHLTYAHPPPAPVTRFELLTVSRNRRSSTDTQRQQTADGCRRRTNEN